MADLGSIGRDRPGGIGGREGNKVGGWRSMNAGGAASHTDAFGKSTALSTSSATSVVGASISIH